MLPKFKSILDLTKRFPDEKSCHQYLASRRWSDGLMTCPYEGCEGEKAYVFKDGIYYKCACCKKKYTARTGTIFECSRIPLQKWFVALYLIMGRRGMSSYQLAATIGVTQKTAWFLAQRIRKILGNEPIKKLEGIVEMDETFVGGKNKFRHRDKKIKYDKGRTWKDKVPVFGMLERGGKVIATVIPSPSKRAIFPLVYTTIQMGSTLMCDEFKAYKSLGNNYGIQTCNHSAGIYGKDGWISTNGMENFWSNFKRLIKGTHIKVASKHLNKYVNESVFRYNYRNLGVQQQMDQALKHMNVRLTYRELTKAA